MLNLNGAGARLRLEVKLSARVTVRVVDFPAAHVCDDANFVKALLGVRRKISERELAREQRVNVAQESVDADGPARALKEGAAPRLRRESVERALPVADEREVRPVRRWLVDRIDG